MGYIKVLKFVIFATILVGCSGKMVTSPVNNQVKKEVSSNTVPPIIVPKIEELKAFDPLEGKTFTFSANQTPIKTILYAVALDTGLNLVVSPELHADLDDPTSENLVSANFVNTSTRDALEIIGSMANVFYEIKGNTLVISKYKTNIYSLPYISGTSQYNASLGGDVVGAADKDGNTNLAGEFTLEYQKPNDIVDFYKNLEENLREMVGQDSTVLVNKMTGIISVRSTYNIMMQVESFLENIVGNAVKQVQIEAKIIEVTLNDSYSYGINWSNLFGAGRVSFDSTASSTGTFTLSITDNFQGVLSAIATYGKIDTLSNPRMTVLNGQNAMISAGTIVPFWDKEVKRERNDGFLETTVTYTKYNVLDGLTMGLTVFVHDDDSVMLNVVPITTTLLANQELKEQDIVVATAPRIEIKEAGTLVQVPDGEILIIGGLISSSKQVTSTSVPLLGDIPFLGYLFSSEQTKMQKKELVIIIKPTVIKSKSKVVKR